MKPRSFMLVFASLFASLPAFATSLPQAASLVGEWTGQDGRQQPCRASVTRSADQLDITVTNEVAVAIQQLSLSELDANLAYVDHWKRQNDPGYTGESAAIVFDRTMGEGREETLRAYWYKGDLSSISATIESRQGPFINPLTRQIAICMGLKKAD